MANQITDNRTLLFDGGDGTGGAPVDLGGGGTGLTDTSTFIQGSTSYTISASNARVGMMFDAGTTQSSWANNTFYLWVNSGVVGLLVSKASGGLTVRFCGSTVTDYFEFYVGGNDSWPTSVAGGWVQFVVDIEGTPSNQSASPPATNACRYVGISNLLSTMPKMADNTWLDAIWRLPDATPGIIVEGRDGGSTDWDSSDVFAQLGAGAGSFREGAGGSYVINTPIQFGINDTSTHGFTDTNKIWLWDNQEWAPSDLYGLSALGNSGGTTNLTMGSKTGSGDSATGAQGLTITGASTGVRWFMDFDDPDLDAIGFYGCSFQHSSDFQIDDASVESISSLFIDGTSATTGGSLFQRNSVINANTADDVAYIVTNDLDNIKYNSFAFSDGHAVEYNGTATATETFIGNTFTGYGADTTTDAALYNSNTSGTLTVNVSGGVSSPTKKTASGGTTIINNNINVTITIKDTAGTVIPGAEVAIFEDTAARTVVLASTETDENGEVTTTSAASLGDIIIRVRQSTDTMSFLTSESTTDGVNSTLEEISNPTLHNFQTGDAVVYDKDGGSESISASITDGNTYYVREVDTTSVKLYATAANAIADTSAFDLLASGTETHKLDPVRYIANSATGTIGASDFSAQITMTADNITTG